MTYCPHRKSIVLCNSCSCPWLYCFLGFYIPASGHRNVSVRTRALCSCPAVQSDIPGLQSSLPQSSSFLCISWIITCTFEGLRKYCQFPAASQKAQPGGVCWFTVVPCSGITGVLGHTGVRVWIASIQVLSSFMESFLFSVREEYSGFYRFY